jgi:hypothetical protein
VRTEKPGAAGDEDAFFYQTGHIDMLNPLCHRVDFTCISPVLSC